MSESACGANRLVDIASDAGAGGWHRRGAEHDKCAASSAARALSWRHVFSGEERRLRDLRHWLTSVLPECLARDDVIVVANELGSNAIRHTASGRGGWFAVEITWQGSVVRVAVADYGSPTEPRVIDDPAAEHGRGLLLVRRLSVRTGIVGGQRGRLVWAEIAWDDPPRCPPEPRADRSELEIQRQPRGPRESNVMKSVIDPIRSPASSPGATTKPRSLPMKTDGRGCLPGVSPAMREQRIAEVPCRPVRAVRRALFQRMQAFEDAIAYRRARVALPCPDCSSAAPGQKCDDHARDLDLISEYLETLQRTALSPGRAAAERTSHELTSELSAGETATSSAHQAAMTAS